MGISLSRHSGQLTHRFDGLLEQQIRLTLVQGVDVAAVAIETADG